MEKENKKFWISTSRFSWFKGLFLNSGSSKAGNWEELICFEKEEDATQFLAKLFGFILKEYPRAKRDSWFKDSNIRPQKIESIKYE